MEKKFQMPANLNALLRYKTINSCLFGGRRKWSVQELMEACSQALAETRGRYEPISERTLRDDIRIMRSDILGFNAPIEQEKGLYYYSDPQFSILNLRITDSGLADKIYFFLLDLRNETKHPELEGILEQLCLLTKREYEEPVVDKLPKSKRVGRMDIRFRIAPGPQVESLEKPAPIESDINYDTQLVQEVNEVPELDWGLSWGGIFKRMDGAFY
jgi:hypothetical protein